MGYWQQKGRKGIGDPVKKDEALLFVNETPVLVSIDGILRGLVSKIRVEVNEKIGDIEPTGDASYCRTISDKARAIGWWRPRSGVALHGPIAAKLLPSTNWRDNGQ